MLARRERETHVRKLIAILTLARKDLRVLLRDTRAAIILLTMPVIFILVLGLALGESFGQKPDDRLRISIVDEDAGLPPDPGPFPGKPWAQAAYQSWRRRAFRRATQAAGLQRARPYALRHSFASLLLHEGRSVIYVARQLGRDARLTLTRYGHVMDELEDTPRIEAGAAIADARRRVGPSDPSGVSEFGS